MTDLRGAQGRMRIPTDRCGGLGAQSLCQSLGRFWVLRVECALGARHWAHIASFRASGGSRYSGWKAYSDRQVQRIVRPDPLSEPRAVRGAQGGMRIPPDRCEGFGAPSLCQSLGRFGVLKVESVFRPTCARHWAPRASVGTSGGSRYSGWRRTLTDRCKGLCTQTRSQSLEKWGEGGGVGEWVGDGG